MKFLEVGQIVSTHGIKGELKVKIITDDLSRFDKGSILYLGDNKKEVTISSSRIHQGMMLITINNLDNINDVLDFVSNKLYYDRDLDDSDSIYYDDLIGCSVVVEEKCVGIVKDILDLPQGPALEVKLNETKDGKEIIKLVPYIDEFIKETDIKNKKIIVTPIEGLL